MVQRSIEDSRWDHELIIGDTYSPAVAYALDADAEAYDLTGSSGTCTVVSWDGEAALLSPTVTIAAGVTGEFSWSDTAANTAALAPQKAKYFVRLTLADGTVKTILRGVVHIRSAYDFRGGL